MLHPRQTPSLIGRTLQVEKIKEAFCQNRLPQGVLLYGPKGVGKATFAYHIARYLFQGSKDNFKVDLETPLFKRVGARSHGDLFVLERNSSEVTASGKEIPIDEVRNALAFLKKSPLEGGFRVVIIDSINELNKNASNALLKSLEEPPSQTLLILIHHGAGGILPTLKSRCQRIFCPPLSEAESKEILKQHLELEASDFNLLAAFARGSAGNVLRLFNTFYGAQVFKDFIGLLESLRQKEFSKVYAFIETLLAQKGADVLESAEILVSWWLDRLRSFALSKDMLEAFPGEKELALYYLKTYSLKKLPAIWQNMETLFKEARLFNLDAKHVLVCTFFEFLVNKQKN